MNGGSVLIVEDEKDVLDVMAEMVTLFGYRATALADGAEALEAIRQSQFDLIITDLGLPGIGGADLVTEIRAEGISTPVLLITGVEYDKVESKFGKSSSVRFLQKPFKMDVLKAAIASALAGKARRTHKISKQQAR